MSDMPAQRRLPCAHGFVPNYLLEALATSKGVDSSTRGLAISTLKISAKLDTKSSIVADDQLDAIEPIELAPANDVLRRKIFDMQSGRLDQPGTLRRKEGDPDYRLDEDVDKCYENIGLTFNFFSKVFQQGSIDHRGMEVIAKLHYGKSFAGAKWLFNKGFMIVGDGFTTDPSAYFGNFARSLDVISHELVHGITSAAIHLGYIGQSGALNESISDVFASMVKQYTHKQRVEEADWLIGQDVFLPQYPHMAMRSLKDPGHAWSITTDLSGKETDQLKDKQVRHYDDLIKPKVPIKDDDVHIFSGIPNYAFYLAAKHARGYSWEKVGKVWYKMLTPGIITSSCTFTEFATATVKASHGFGADVVEAVKTGWDGVGVPYSE